MRQLIPLLLLTVLPAVEPPAGSLARAEDLQRRLAPLSVAKREPADNDWLARHREPGQTLRDYIVAAPNRPARGRSTLYTRLIGAGDPTQAPVLASCTAALAIFYPAPAGSLPPLTLGQVPAKARRAGPYGEQLLSPWLLDRLKAERPADALAVLGLSASDLWPGEGWNFVFGQASLGERVGVWSLVRFAGAGEQRLRERALKLALHETGHQFGLLHCIRWECLMNGSNHLAELDAAPLPACHECEAKLLWSFGGDPHARLLRLAVFAREHRLESAQRHWERSAALLAAAP